MEEWIVLGLILLGVLLVLVFSGAPIAVGLMLTAFIFIALRLGPVNAMNIAANEARALWAGWFMIPLALFILMAELLTLGGIADDLFEVASKWLRRIPGGLALVTIGACAIFGTMSGSSLSAAATFGIIAIPQMQKRGYSKRLSTGCVAAAGGLAHLIPPSILMLIYASMAELSIGKQFMAGILPGFLLTCAYATVTVTWVLLRPSAALREAPVSWRERLVGLRLLVAPVFIVFAVLGTIFLGIASATEASALGAVAAILVSIIRRRVNWVNLRGAFMGAARTTCFIMFIALGGKLLSWVLNYYLIPQHILTVIVGMEVNPWMVLILIQILYIFLGCILDPIGMLFVTIPLVLPIILGLGFDPIWFGILLMINIEMATVTPPMGGLLYIIKGLVGEDISLGDILRGALLFCIADLITLAIVMAFPQIALWLPSIIIK